MMRWRSLLFIPANDEARLAKAGTRGADAVILDLEDGVAPAEKPAARAALPRLIAVLAAQQVDLVVRVNPGWRTLMADLDAAVRPGVAALMLPKATDASAISVIDAMVAEWESERGLAAGGIGLVALVESPAALPGLSGIASIQRVWGLALGTEDFALEMGVPPSPALLDLPCRQLALAAAPRRLMALGVPFSIAAFRDTAGYRAAAEAALAMGCTGAICVHPCQVEIANMVFGRDESARAEAHRVIDEWESAKVHGQAVISRDGHMIDLPVVARARRLLGME